MADLQDQVRFAIDHRGLMPCGGIAIELSPTREKISETQVIHSFKSVYSQALVSVNALANHALEINDRMKMLVAERQALTCAAPPLSPRPRRRKTKKR